MTTGRINQVAVSWPATRARGGELRAAGLARREPGRRANVCCAGAAEEGSGAEPLPRQRAGNNEQPGVNSRDKRTSARHLGS